MKNTYVKYFNDENDAFNRCKSKNRACKAAGNYKEMYAVVDGPDNNWAVVDLNTAIDLGMGYEMVG